MAKIQLLGTVPVVPVTDVAEAVAFYGDSLGFALAFHQGEYAGVERGAAHLHLDGVANDGAGKVTARVTVSGVDALYAEIEPTGVVDPAEPINTKPWGARQFSVLDCCGNRITFVEGA
jgi:catechol 2,3-dioxygenase-like lactoylglutathione lyase family enzyme